MTLCFRTFSIARALPKPIKRKLLYFIVSSFLLINHSNVLALELDIKQVDAYLIGSEKQFSDIIEGTQKKVRWYQSKQQKTKYSIVYLHGFSASSQELNPTTELLADQLQANVFYTRLTGHGRSDDAMAEASTDDWKNDTKQAYKIGQLIGENVIFISTSTGGTLATWLLNQKDIKQPFANIMISPNYAVANNSAWMIKYWLGLKIAKLIKGDYYQFQPLSDAHAKYWTERYPIEAIRPMLSLLDDVESMDKSITTTPQLIVYSPDDKVIDVSEIKSVAKQFTNSSTTLHEFVDSTDPYQHVLSGLACSEQSTGKMVETLLLYILSLTKDNP